MNKRITGAIVGGVAVAVLGSGVAYAAVAAGPPVDPGTVNVGPYYTPGAVVNLCVNTVTEQLRAEVRTQTLGNCGANEVQLTVVQPSPTSSTGG